MPHDPPKLRQQILNTSADQSKSAEFLFLLDQLRTRSGLQGIEVVDKETEWVMKAKEELLRKADALLVTGSSSQNQADTGKKKRKSFFF
jgi:hypothetical protein